MPVWPGEVAPIIGRTSSILAGDGANVSFLAMGVHTGTHVDAPAHFLPDGAGVDSIRLQDLMGIAELRTIEGSGEITAAALESLKLPEGTERLLLRTDNRRIWGPESERFDPSFVALSRDASSWLVERGFRLVGIDYLSIQPFSHTGPDVHETLLKAGIVIVEGLDLGGVVDGSYEMVCLPVLVPGADGAPARVVVRSTEVQEGGVEN